MVISVCVFLSNLRIAVDRPLQDDSIAGIVEAQKSSPILRPVVIYRTKDNQERDTAQDCPSLGDIISQKKISANMDTAWQSIQGYDAVFTDPTAFYVIESGNNRLVGTLVAMGVNALPYISFVLSPASCRAESVAMGERANDENKSGMCVSMAVQGT